MAKVTPIQTNFTAGEFSPQLEGRVDIARYGNAVSTLENFVVTPFGGADRTPGTVFVAPAKFPGKKCRMIPFQFSTEQAYMLEVGEGYIRFYRENAAITEASLTIIDITQANPMNVEITTHGLSVGDEIIINGVVGMTELNGKRFRVDTVVGPDDINLEDLDGNIIDSTAFTAYISGGTADKIVEIANPWTEAQLLNIQHAQTADLLYFVERGTPIQKLTRMSDTSWTLTAPTIVGGPFQTLNPDSSITVTPSATSGAITITASSPIFTAAQVGGLFVLGGVTGAPPTQGYVTITGFTSTTVVDATVEETLTAGATSIWAHGSFSDEAGYPQAIGFHEQRLYVGGTLFEPQTIFGSVILAFEDFTAGEALDVDAVKFEIATEQVNAIRWLNSGRGLGIGTAGGTFIGSSGADFQAITPTNISVRRETNYGSELILPKRIGNFLYYVQRGGRKIREFAYNFDIDAHLSLDMTLLSEQITNSGILNQDFQQSPHSILWQVRNDGQIATMTRQQDQEVIAWSRQVPSQTIANDNAFESVATIPKGEEDQVWTSVKRTVDGTTRRFIEYYSPIDFGDTVADAFFVQSGLTYTGVSTTTLSGLDHLEGEDVDVLNEGRVHQGLTVTGGAITLPTATTKAHVGLPYLSQINSLKLEGGSALGTSQGKIARVVEVMFRFYKTVGALFGREGNTNEIFFRNTNDMMDTAVPLFTGDKRVQFPQGYDREPRVFIKQEQPLPMSILAIAPQYEVFEK